MSKIPGLLTSQEVLENIINSTVAPENIQQHGIDLNLIKVFKLDSTSFGCVSRTKSTELSNRVEITPNTDGYFELTPGSYDIVFEQGVNVKANNALFIRQRSSLTRNGCTISSSIYDAGFKTEHLGTVLKVGNPIKIELGARVGYLYGHHCESVDNLYNGQFQNK